MVGNCTGLVVALHHMSKHCIKCEIGEKTGKEYVHHKSMCAHNYLGSSKGSIHLHTHHDVVYEIIVMDNDSLTENSLKWNFVDALAEGLIMEIPKTPGGIKEIDKGQLSLTHPPILQLAAHIHCIWYMAGTCYLLAHAPKSKSMCSTADAERLKCNLTYGLHQYKGHDFKRFKRMLWAIFYHHFNIHDTCGEWCSLLKNTGNPEKLNKLHYQYKVENAKLYEQLLEIWEICCSDETLQDVHHSCHTNKCESVNQFIVKLICKSYHLVVILSWVGRVRTLQWDLIHLDMRSIINLYFNYLI
jgi:hypothetical protein